MTYETWLIYIEINIIMIFFSSYVQGTLPVSLFTQVLLIKLSKCQLYFVVFRSTHDTPAKGPYFDYVSMILPIFDQLSNLVCNFLQDSAIFIDL